MRYRIVGVVKDMVVESPYSPTGPVVYYEKGLNGGVSWMEIKVKPGAVMSQALPKIEAVMKRLIPSRPPLTISFADEHEDYALKFASEVRMSKLAGFFARSRSSFLLSWVVWPGLLYGRAANKGGGDP